MKIQFFRASVIIAAVFSVFTFSALSQTVSLNDGSILRSSPHRAGINIGSIDYWGNGEVYKNLIGISNPGFEPLLEQQIWTIGAAGSTTTFTVPDTYDTVPANYWTGGTFKVVESQSGGAELGCTGTIASNTGPNYPLSTATWTSPTITVSTPCGAPFSAGDEVILSKTFSPTPESWWETGGNGGIAGSVNGGGQLLSDTTDLCATCGTQALNMNASAAGSSAGANWYFDSEYNDNLFVLLNGTYQLTFWAKAASGTPVLTASANRLSAGGMNCGSFTPKLTNSWAQYTWTCSAAETASGTAPGTGHVSINVTGGSVYLDNVSFAKANTDPSNTTVFRDEVIDTLKTFYGPNVASNPGVFRYWVNQNAESVDNWTQPDYAHFPTSGGTGYFVGPNGAGSESLSLEDYLEICKLLGVEPYLEVPVTLSTTDAGNLIEFLAGASGTTYGNKRSALGQVDPWTSAFAKIHLAFCNECWNGQSFAGQSLAYRSTALNGEYYYDYSVRARDIFAAMRANSSYTSSSFDLVMGAQTAVNWSMDNAIARAHPDSVEINGYEYEKVSSFASDAALWQPAMVDPYLGVTTSADVENFYTSLHDYQSQTTCGASGTATCGVNVYEWGQNTLGGGIDQAHMDHINAGAGQAVIYALQPLLNIQYYGIPAQSMFSLTEFKNGGISGQIVKLWGGAIDMGGATNNVRPTFLGAELANSAIIGPMYSCPINNNVTFNFAGSPNGTNAMPAVSNVPYLYSFCFENGSQRSIVLINTDLTNSHTVSFSGTNVPQGSVAVNQIAPSSPDLMNEAPTGGLTNLTQATVAIEPSSLSNPGSVTLPPDSVTSLQYSLSGTPEAAAPSFTPAAGTYTSAQSVSISTSTSGATIYYTTNGSTPSTSSTQYSGPITVSGTETLQAIAVASGYTNSYASSATYTINNSLPTPTFSPAPGSYTSMQVVSISDATAGTTIYYTTNGTTPTTSSTVYTGPISVSSSQTINAIAAKTGYTNSAAASGAYTINSTLSAPTFSPAGGSYSSAQTVSISDATAGTTIYYTTNGTTPTTSSTVYSGPISVSASETLNAIAVKSGSTNSSVATASYTISLATVASPIFSPGGGTFSAAQSVTISDSTTGATIYYTTDGSTPTTSSAKYSAAISVINSATLKAIAVKSGSSNSAVASATYTITIGSSPVTQTLPAPSFAPAGGTYTSAQTVTSSDATSGSTIYYTTDGTTPTTASPIYNGSILVGSTKTLKAIAVKSGYGNSPMAAASYTISASSGTGTTTPSTTYINYPTNGFTLSNMSMNYGATISSGVLKLTDGGQGEDRSAWSLTKVPISTFTTDFTFQLLNAKADGFTFTIQNDHKGIWALGYGESGLGYQGILKSVAVKFDIYNNGGEGNDSTGVFTNGVLPTVPSTDLSKTGIVLASGDLIHAHLVYNGTTLFLTLTDTKTGATVTEQYTINIPSIVGGSSAYVGFTGGTGSQSAVQEITSWTFQ